MHYHIEQGLQKNASFVYGNFYPEEIDSYINKMILRFVKDRWDKSDNEELGFEEIQKRLDDIRVLISHASVDTDNGTNGNTYIDLEPDYMFFVTGSGVATVGYDDCLLTPDPEKDYSVPLRVVKHSKLPVMSRDPYSRSSVNTGLLCTIQNHTLKVIGDKKSILKGVTYNYIRIPEKVDVNLGTDCELAEHTHDEIVDLTVQHILEVIESRRYQTNSVQVRKSE